MLVYIVVISIYKQCTSVYIEAHRSSLSPLRHKTKYYILNLFILLLYHLCMGLTLLTIHDSRIFPFILCFIDRFTYSRLLTLSHKYFYLYICHLIPFTYRNIYIYTKPTTTKTYSSLSSEYLQNAETDFVGRMLLH